MTRSPKLRSFPGHSPGNRRSFGWALKFVAKVVLFCIALTAADVLLVAMGGGGATPVAAQEPPAPPAIPPGCPGGPPGMPVPGTECPDGSVPGAPGPPTTAQPAPEDPLDADAQSTLASDFALDSGEGHPLTAYDIGCDEGAWNAFLRKLWCGAQALPFALGKWFIGIGSEMLGWALEFRIADSLTPMAGTLSRVYDTSLIERLDIRTLAWTVTVLVAGWQLMRARFADGVREIATTFLVAALGIIVLANPQGYLEGSVELAQNTSGAVLESVDGALTGTPSQDADAIRERLGVVLRRSFVAEPYDLINWGGPLSGECAAARDEILAGGPWGGESRPREIMVEHGCQDQADFNARPTDNRAVSSLTVASAAGLVTVLMGILALAVFVAQLTLIALFAGASFAWAIALFPGGRGILTWWISRLVWAVLVTFATVFLLAWIALTVTVVLDSTSEISIVQRSLITIMIVAVAFKMRSSVDRAIDAASSRLGNTLRRATQSSGQPSRGFAAIGAGRPAALPPGAPPAGAQPAATGGFGPMSWSPTRTAITAASVGGAIAAGSINAARTGAERGRSTVGGAIRGTRNVGATAFKGTKAVVMAPIRVPERYAQTRARSTQRASNVRDRLATARETRSQWARNVRHPVGAVRDAKSKAARSSADTRDWM